MTEKNVGISEAEIKRQGLAAGQNIQLMASLQGLCASFVIGGAQRGIPFVVHGQYRRDVSRASRIFCDRFHDVWASSCTGGHHEDAFFLLTQNRGQGPQFGL